MEKKFSAETIFSAISRVVNRVFTQSSVMGLMLFITILTSSCSKEIANVHPSQASDLITSNIDSLMRLGHTEAWWSGEAKTAEGIVVDGNGRLIYDGLPKVYVPTLGLPTNVTANKQGSVFTSDDGNVFNRTFDWQSSTGVNGSSTGTWERTIIVSQLNDSTELVEAQFNENWSVWTDKLPSGKEASKSGNVIVRVPYLRVVKPTPVEITYRKSIILDFEDALAKNKAYGDMKVEKMQGENVLSTWCHYDIMAKWGEFDPQVSAQYVTSFEFTSHDVAGESKELDADLPGLGDGGCFTRKNVRHTAETFEVQFPSTADTNGNTVRPIRGQIDVWVYTYTFENPEDNHKETFEVEFEVKSVKSEVSGNVYERIIEVRINGEVVDTQNGKVELILG
jgi:hypothetical protein